jgi:RNA polymerase sigma-70 factor (ECF subfamily)
MQLVGQSTEELFQKAVREQTRRLLSIARAIVGNSATAEDVVQQAFANLYQHRNRYDWRDPGGLLRRTVVNESLRILRQPRPAALSDETAEAGSFTMRSRTGGRGTGPLDGMVERETTQTVRRAIQRLPDHFRAALVLCEYEQMSYVQIADVLDATIPQVKTWIHRGRRQLAQSLKDLAPARWGA